MKTLRDKLRDNPVPKFRTINPEKEHGSGDYNSYFLDRYEKHTDLNEVYGALKKDPNDMGAKEDAGDYMYGDPNFYKNLGTDTVLSDLEGRLSESTEAIGSYSKKNQDVFYEKLKKENYEKLIQKVPLYKKDDNSDHDAFVDIINEVKKIQSAGEDPQKMLNYLIEKADNNQDPELQWFKNAIYSNANNSKYIQKLYGLYANESNKLFGAAMEKVDAEKVFKDSLSEAKTEFDKETLEKEKQDIWERNIRPYYMALTNEVYNIEDKKANEDLPKWKEERNERRDRRRKIKNMPK